MINDPSQTTKEVSSFSDITFSIDAEDNIELWKTGETDEPIVAFTWHRNKNVFEMTSTLSHADYIDREDVDEILHMLLIDMYEEISILRYAGKD